MIRTALALVMAAVPAVAQASWHQATAKHFVVYADDDPGKLATFAADLERYDKAMRLVRNLPDGPVAQANRVVVYVVPDQAAIEALEGSGVAGFYRPIAGRPTAFVPRTMRNDDDPRKALSAGAVLRHEYAHHFMFNNFDAAALPLWLVEGYAEFNATAVNNADGSVTIGRAPNYRADVMFDNGALGLKDVLVAGTARQVMTSVQYESVYAKGWLLVHYLTFEPSRRGQLGAYIAALHDGKGAAEAARVFGDLGKLDKELETYLHQKRLKSFTIASAGLKIDPVVVRPVSAGEAAMMKIHIRSAAGVSTSSAASLVGPARRVAQGFSNDAGAQLALAEAEYDARHYAEARDAADRVIAADPQREKAYVYKSMALAGLAKAGKKADPATWTAVRAPLLQANRLDADDAAALKLFYTSFGDAGQVPSANARIGLQQALYLAPQDNDLRTMVVADDIEGGRIGDARSTLLPLLSDPHSPRQRTWGAELLAALDSGDIKAAQAKVRAPVDPKKKKDDQ